MSDRIYLLSCISTFFFVLSCNVNLGELAKLAKQAGTSTTTTTTQGISPMGANTHPDRPLETSFVGGDEGVPMVTMDDDSEIAPMPNRREGTKRLEVMKQLMGSDSSMTKDQCYSKTSDAQTTMEKPRAEKIEAIQSCIQTQITAMNLPPEISAKIAACPVMETKMPKGQITDSDWKASCDKFFENIAGKDQTTVTLDQINSEISRRALRNKDLPPMPEMTDRPEMGGDRPEMRERAWGGRDARPQEFGEPREGERMHRDRGMSPHRCLMDLLTEDQRTKLKPCFSGTNSQPTDPTTMGSPTPAVQTPASGN